ncbi:hypothetical protein [Agromyces aureus]|uniref:Uncharacterized protein n=1 Tax=Agromyces aureus TaxID=453304 RepID=A0A191WEW4_9MICO|nr:hypothetical protein [Agromyces aureus]ANJ26820.1 hypothetical protein ATC03_08910 [Agromyces aureus]
MSERKVKVSLEADVSDFTRKVAEARRSLDGVPLTTPVEPDVQAAIQRWAFDHGEDLNRRLEPFGLGNYNIAMPVFRRVVTLDEEGQK